MRKVMILAAVMGLILAVLAGVALATTTQADITPQADIDGDSGDNVLVGTGVADTINGRGGDDYLYGLRGNDEVNGGDGRDQVDGGPGSDDLNGNDDNDFLDSVDRAGDDTVNCGTGSDDVAADRGDTVRGNCESVRRFSF